MGAPLETLTDDSWWTIGELSRVSARLNLWMPKNRFKSGPRASKPAKHRCQPVQQLIASLSPHPDNDFIAGYVHWGYSLLGPVHAALHASTFPVFKCFCRVQRVGGSAQQTILRHPKAPPVTNPCNPCGCDHGPQSLSGRPSRKRRPTHGSTRVKCSAIAAGQQLIITAAHWARPRCAYHSDPNRLATSLAT